MFALSEASCQPVKPPPPSKSEEMPTWLDADAPHRVVDMVGEVGDGDGLRLGVAAEERRHRGDLDHAARVAQRIELRIVHVARMVAQGTDAGMRGHHRRARHVRRLQHRVARDVRDIDQHAEPVELGDRGAAERAETAVLGFGRRRDRCADCRSPPVRYGRCASA